MNKSTNIKKYQLELRKLRSKFGISQIKDLAPTDQKPVTKPTPNKGKSKTFKNNDLVKTKINKIQLKGELHPDLFKPGSRLLNAYIVVLKSISNNWSETDLVSFVNSVYTLYQNKIKHHGVTGGTAKYKEISVYTLSLAEGRNPCNPNFVATEPLTKVPTSLKVLQPLIESVRGNNNRKDYQILSTLLAIPRMSESLPELDISSVVNPIKDICKGTFKSYLTLFTSFVQTCKMKPTNQARKLWVHPSTRMTSGPNSGPTLSKSAEEAKLLLSTKSLNLAYKDLCTLTGNEHLYDYLTKLSELPLELDEIYLSKLLLVPDSLNKHRLVAIVDYWTNLILDPIESLVKEFVILNFPADHMMNHGRGADVVKSKSKDPLWSIDLKDWTNRFPALLQQKVLAKITSPRLSDAWYRLIVDREFWVPAIKKYIKFGVGQPMGSKLSFVLATATHHMFILHCWEQVRKDRPFKEVHELYVIVGDDLVIFDEDLFKQVTRNNNFIGVEISTNKSKLPLDGVFWAEFCSRTYVNGVDVSRISPKVINQASKSWDDIPLLLTILKDREVNIPSDLLPTFRVLCKKDKDGVTYLQHLKDALTSHLRGLQGLFEIGDQIPGPNNWLELDVSESDMATIELNYSLAKSIRVLEDTVEYCLGKRKLPRKYYLLPDEDKTKFEAGKPQVEVLIQHYSFFDLQIIDDGQTKTEEVLKTSYVLDLASDPEIRPKDWKFDLPHPSSIAIIMQIKQMFCFLLNHVPSYDDKAKEVDEVYNTFIYNIGFNVQSILPKEAESLIARGKGLHQYYKHQSFLSRKILKAYTEMKRIGGTELVFTDIKCKFDLPDRNKPVLQSILKEDLDPDKFQSDSTVSMDFMFNIVLGDESNDQWY